MAKFVVISSGLLILLVLVFICGCVQQQQHVAENQTASSITTSTFAMQAKLPYRVVSLENLTKEICRWEEDDPNPTLGIRIKIKDKETGEALNGSSVIDFKKGTLYLHTDELQCMDEKDDNYYFISVFSDGHSPEVFVLDLPRNSKIVTLEVMLRKTGAAELSCYQNYDLYLNDPYLNASRNNQTYANELRNNFRHSISSMIADTFALNETDYTLDLLDCSLNVGGWGFIKARGIYRNETPFNLYYRWGYCSPGGAGCDWNACFTSISGKSDDLYNRVNDRLCSNIQSLQRRGDDWCSGTSGAYDNTTQVKQLCYSGLLGESTGDQKTISFIQEKGRCRYAVQKGKTKCLEY